MGRILAEIAGRISTLLAVYDEDFYNLLCDAQGHLQVDVLSSALPSGAATATNQATIITAVQSLQNLVGALHDVGVDELDVVVASSALPSGAATETTLGLVKDRLGALTSPAGGSTNKLLTDALTALQLIDNLYGALHSQHTDELDVVVESSALPTDAATQTTLALCLTALQLIDNLYGALESQASDRLIVRGEDQLFSFKDVLSLFESTVISGASGWAPSDACPADEIWHITNIMASDDTSPTTTHLYQDCRNGAIHAFGATIRAIAAGEHSYWSGHVWLGPTDFIRVYFTGGLIDDVGNVTITGFRMTLET